MPPQTSSEASRAADLEKTENDVEAQAGDASIPAGVRDENEDDYPDGWKKVTVIMLAVYLSMFIVALVRLLHPILSSFSDPGLTEIGSNNIRHRHTENYR